MASEISAVIPCYNASKYLSEVLSALKAQTLPFSRIILVDDGSSDDSGSIAQSFGIEVIRNSHNVGLAASRNVGLFAVDTPFVAFIDSDVVLEQEWLSRALSKFTETSIAILGGRLIERNQVRAPDLWRKLHLPQDNGEELKDFSIECQGRIAGFAYLARTNALKAVGGYNEKYKRTYEDIDMCERLIKKGFSLAYRPDLRASHIRFDDVFSLLRTAWNWDLWPQVKLGRYNSIHGYFFKNVQNFIWFVKLISKNVRYNPLLIYIDCLLLLTYTVWDLNLFLWIRSPSFRDKFKNGLISAAPYYIDTSDCN